jgi:nicotinamidase-related amidase
VFADLANSALITSECQKGVIGPVAALPQLAEAAQTTVIPNGAKLCAAAREAGIPVLHCTAGRRADGRGSNTNARLFMAMRKAPRPIELGDTATQVIDEFDVQPSDLVLSRMHGLSPMAGTDLDPILRNFGVSALVIAGVSLNVAIPNLVFDAINLGYRVVLPRDAVVGVPPSYGEQVLENTLSLLAELVTTDEVIREWSAVNR